VGPKIKEARKGQRNARGVKDQRREGEVPGSEIGRGGGWGKRRLKSLTARQRLLRLGGAREKKSALGHPLEIRSPQVE